MAAKYILSTVAVVFLAMTLARAWRDQTTGHPQTLAWGLTGLIFAAVSIWLWLRN